MEKREASERYKVLPHIKSGRYPFVGQLTSLVLPLHFLQETPALPKGLKPSDPSSTRTLRSRTSRRPSTPGLRHPKTLRNHLDHYRLQRC
ncbi:hypothetical protein BaRGS_00010236 [Batillaria attramentaria]|uniref:Uncharacterized protein n=1 Tax=Batillaria attramentaria TaxID=370345 RepID=A0ABD0LH53_9CAEN